MNGVVSVASLAKSKLLPERFLRELGVEDLPAGGVSIPYYDFCGAPLFTRKRDVPCRPRFQQPRGVSLAPYGRWRLDRARRHAHLYLMEGESDCWAMWQSGLPALGIPGAQSAGCLTAEDLSGVEAVYVLPDADAAGGRFVEGVTRRLARLERLHGAYRLDIRQPGCKDVCDLRVKLRGRFLPELESMVRVRTPLTAPEDRFLAARVSEQVREAIARELPAAVDEYLARRKLP